MKNLTSESTEEERKLIETLIKYPSLESVFDQNQPSGFAEIKQKLQETISNLERVIRRGEKTDAERAGVVIEAYQTAINFLSELETLRKSQLR
jgi:hypothetical protein